MQVVGCLVPGATEIPIPGKNVLLMSLARALFPRTRHGSRKEQGMDADASAMSQPKHELRFLPLFDAERAYAFPCDAHGHVDLNALSDRALNDYLFARVFVGRTYRAPTVEAVR
jgi:hypothetical protein